MSERFKKKMTAQCAKNNCILPSKCLFSPPDWYGDVRPQDAKILISVPSLPLGEIRKIPHSGAVGLLFPTSHACRRVLSILQIEDADWTFLSYLAHMFET